MIGVIDDIKRVCTQYFKKENEIIILLGLCKEELGGSEYLEVAHGLIKGDAPELDLRLEGAVQRAALEAIKRGLVSSAHDCSEGGLAVALAECCVSNKENAMGALIDNLDFIGRKDTILFGESQSRILLSCNKKYVSKIEDIAKRFAVPFQTIGRTGGKKLKILNGKRVLIDLPIKRMADKWTDSLRLLITA